MRPTAQFQLYQCVSSLALPFIAQRCIAGLRKAGVSAFRAHEILGHATQPRRFGRLIWFHAASVGETRSVLPLIAHLACKDGTARFLLTTATAASAEAVQKHLPQNTVHQFAPLDGRGPLRRFLDHWRPDLCCLVESELWPTLLDTCARRKIPVALVNARLSDRSASRWQRFPRSSRYVLRGITMADCQTDRSRDQLLAMGVSCARAGRNLKSLKTRSKIPDGLERARSSLGNRPVWVAASTHAGEEKTVLAAHNQLLVRHPQLCLILVPRHPARSDEILGLITAAGLSVAQRSAGGSLDEGRQVYLADTIGETALWYALSPIVFLGGSLNAAGGHNPFEPAAANCAILHGPGFANFSDAYNTFLSHEASALVTDSPSLAQAVDGLLARPNRAADMARHAQDLLDPGEDALRALGERLLAMAAQPDAPGQS